MKAKQAFLLKFICFLCASFILVYLYPTNSFSNVFVYDDFEYWSTPQNFGWKTQEPSYPVFGFGIGYGAMRTIIDLQEGSRVLEVLYNPTVFNRLEPYTIYNNMRMDQTGNYITQKIISFKIWSEFAIEDFQLFKFIVSVKTKSNKNYFLTYRPTDTPEPKLVQNSLIINIGREYQDGTWHCVVRNLEEDLQTLLPTEEIQYIIGVAIQGTHFRVDDIQFHDDMNFLTNRPPELWRIGPQFATIFTEFVIPISARDPDGDFLDFKATIGGYGANGVGPTKFIYRLPMDPNDPQKGWAPDIVLFYFIPYTFEDYVITIKVSDGELSDVETFTLSIVSFPIQELNHPPYLEELDDKVGYIGEKLNIQIYASDIDLMDVIVYSATIDGQPTYSYGPWVQSIINPITGVIDFTPEFEGNHWINVIVRDSKGMYAMGGFELIVVNQGTWLNHAPVITKSVQNPQVAKAGQEYIIPLEITDPDGEKLYFSSNMGSVTERQDGVQGCVFRFLSHFPGQYVIRITAFDIRGAFVEETFLLDVQPWWSS